MYGNLLLLLQKMPRPGPRPYECVRRAWHSDRHGSIRGSSIQQIFRVAHESHGAATKKNKEWLQKLPAVVFKAEEIIYSKANSEAEYMNVETLRERIDDAIDTIIRRDESTEGGQCLPPCIEAALHLGCVQVRASRSQRDSNPRIYLSCPRAQSPTPDSSRSSNIPPEERRPPLIPVHAETQPKHTRPETRNTTHLLPDPNNTKVSSSSSSPNSLMDLGSVYPLYYGTHYPPQEQEPQADLQVPEYPRPNTILLGTPIRPFFQEPLEISSFRSPFSRGMECDLSLRLGIERTSTHETEQEVRESAEFHPQLNKEFCFFPEKGSASASTSKGIPENEVNERAVKRRKALFTSHEEDVRFSLQPELRSNRYDYGVRRPG